jgi:hypothetical protein
MEKIQTNMPASHHGYSHNEILLCILLTLEKQQFCMCVIFIKQTQVCIPAFPPENLEYSQLNPFMFLRNSYRAFICNVYRFITSPFKVKVTSIDNIFSGVIKKDKMIKVLLLLN